ncbi:MAG: HAMP domain-containing protein [Chloroflexi bacterium]|nr:HAMP domain-containing protein [Chloroflexota bacterium]
MSRLARLFSWRSLRTRISLALVGLTLTLGIVALFQAGLDLTAILKERLQNRGIAIARDLAVRNAAPSLTNDVFALYEAINDSLLNNEDVRYIFLVEPSGEVRVHTFEEGVPPGLVEANRWDPAQRASVWSLRTTEGAVLDIAVPVLGGQGGVIRVGMSEAGLRSRVMSYMARLSLLVGVAVLGAVALSFGVSSLLTRPLSRVAAAARKVGSGDLSTRVPANAGDEVGELAQAFNTMTEDLLRSRESLIQRNAELEILNSMADALSRQLARQQVLDTSLDRLLELTQVSFAWVCIRKPGGRMELAACRGIPLRSLDSPKVPPGEACRCLEVFTEDRGRGTPSLPSSCPLLNGVGGGVETPVRSHSVVPLWSRDGVAGVLGVASPGAGEFDEARTRLLTAIGHQVGIALDNATLYEELERKERVRAELLEKVIGAQEEERKRVAREIHDEPAQALAGVIFQVDNLKRRLAGVKDAGPSAQDVEELRQGVRAAMESLHRIITELRPQALDDLGFVTAIRWYAEQRLADRGVDTDLTVDGQADRLPPAIEIAAFRITQEAVNNVAKHAAASKVRITLRFGDSTISGEIEDDGQGFDPQIVTGLPSHGAGLGLLGMRERAALLGGNLTVDSSPGRGTRVSFTIPRSERSSGHE